MWRTAAVLASLVGVFALAGCADETTPLAPDQEVERLAPDQVPAAARRHVTAVPSDPTPDRVAVLVETVNAEFASRGVDARVNDIWLFTVGAGTDPYRRLRTGARWPWNPVLYYLDVPDFTPQQPASAIEAVLERSYERWNEVKASSIRAERITPSVGNVDIFDGQLDLDPTSGTTCDSNIDLTAEVWDPGYPYFTPAADIVVGGWMSGDWFSECFGANNILGITITLSYGDVDADQYTDRIYVEQYYNEAFDWVLSGAQILGPGEDLESIATHENGHALGLGHYGGAGKVPPGLFASGNLGMIFSPQAVMNPGYLGGEKRELYSIDEAALRTLY